MSKVSGQEYRELQTGDDEAQTRSEAVQRPYNHSNPCLN